MKPFCLQASDGKEDNAKPAESSVKKAKASSPEPAAAALRGEQEEAMKQESPAPMEEEVPKKAAGSKGRGTGSRGRGRGGRGRGRGRKVVFSSEQWYSCSEPFQAPAFLLISAFCTVNPILCLTCS